MTKCTIVIGLIAATAPIAAQAQEASNPFSAEFVIELENDFTFDSSNNDNELSDTFFTIEGALSLSLGPNSSIQSSLVFEPVIDASGDRFIEDHGLFAEELYYAQEFRGVEFVLGKFNPAFGSAWDLAPGIFGVDFAEDYESNRTLGCWRQHPNL